MTNKKIFYHLEIHLVLEVGEEEVVPVELLKILLDLRAEEEEINLVFKNNFLDLNLNYLILCK